VFQSVACLVAAGAGSIDIRGFALEFECAQKFGYESGHRPGVNGKYDSQYFILPEFRRSALPCCIGYEEHFLFTEFFGKTVGHKTAVATA
jgi:hypothetical protein